MLKTVTLVEIEQIFTVLDRLGISREAVVIPLRTAAAGSVRRLPSGTFEIVVAADVPFEVWLATLEPQLQLIGGNEGGSGT